MGAVVHVDTEFTPYERQIIDEAVRDLRAQSGINISIHYDLDYGNLEVVSALAEQKKLTRVGSSSEAVSEVDKYFYHTYAWTTWKRNIWLVWDRMWSRQMMKHVVMHEVLHALGVDHVKDGESVMYELTDAGHMSTELNESDREAIRRAVAPH